VSPRLRSERKFGRPAVLTGRVLLSVTLNRHFDPRDLVLHCPPKRCRHCRPAQPPDRRIGAARGSRNTKRRLVSKGDGSLDSLSRRRSKTDEAKREFIFLALLWSHPTLSWIALRFPDGAFFGALRAAGNEIDMVEVKQNPKTGIRQQRVDTYTPEPGDVFFRARKRNRSVPRRHSQRRNRVLCTVAPMPDIAVGPLPALLRLRFSATAII